MNRIGNVCQYGAVVDNSRRRPSKVAEELAEIMEHLEEGKDIRWLSQNGFQERVSKVILWIKAYVSCIPPKTLTKPRTRLTVLQGEAGTGKSSLLEQLLPPEEIFHKSNASQSFWDGYHPIKHKSVICEEISRQTMKFNTLKEITGSTATTVDVKNQPSVPMLADKLFLLTNSSFEKLYKLKCDEQIAALFFK